MDYADAATFLFDLRRYPPRPGLEATRDLLAHLGDPQEGIEYVQIAGSNGKGSTACMTASVLEEAGLDVGLYTSPHTESVRERVQVNGRRIPKQSVVAFVEQAREYVTERAADGAAPTFFEALTALAFFEFGRRDVDVSVLEVGIGGRYDATSVVSPTASAVTSVALEHTDFLGDTIEEIAVDKAQVAPEGKPLVTAATSEARAAIEAEVGDVLVVGEKDNDGSGGDGGSESNSNGDNDGYDDSEVDGSGTDALDVRVRYEGRKGIEGRASLAGDGWGIETRLGLLGAHQARNAGVAAALCRQVGSEGSESGERDDVDGSADASVSVPVSEAILAQGLRRARWPARFEVMGRDPLVVLDGAHNPGACETLADTLAEFVYDDLHLVFGAMCDKDAQEMVRALPTPDHVLTTQPMLSRAEDAGALATVFERAGIEHIATEKRVADAVERALADVGPDDCVLVTGSLYTVAEARPLWSRSVAPARVDDRADATRVLSRAGVAERERSTADELLGHTIETRANGREARGLVGAMKRIGGTGAVSALDAADRERRGVVLGGSHEEFVRLVGAIESGAVPAVGDGLARDLRARLDVGVGGDAEASGDTAAGEDTTTGDGAEESAAATATAGEARSPTPGGSSGLNGGATGTDASAYPWHDRTAVMGILNTTPDSFHDGGRYEAISDAVARAEEMVAAGVDIVDVGGESTRPGADPVSVNEEIERVRPVIERICELDALVSIDTRKVAVARAAIEAGADVLNDVSGLSDPEMRFVAADHDVPIVIMHSIDAPVVPGKEIDYDDVVADVISELEESVLAAEQAGVPREAIVVDPGLGFGKRAAESFELLGRLDEFHALGCAVLAGHSHKSMFDLVDPASDAQGASENGLAATVAGSAIAAERGADIVRVHDVAESVAAVRVTEAANDPGRFVNDG